MTAQENSKDDNTILTGAAGRAMSVADDVTAQIKTLIQTEPYRSGRRLPGERVLARQLGVGRPSVRHALSTLTQLGMLETRPGSGTRLASSGANVLKTPFELLLLLEQPSIEELYETRELVEVYLAGRAAERRTPDDLAAIESALAAMRDQVNAPEQMTDPNVRFHEAVAAAAHLPIMERFINCLHDGIRACIEATRPGVRDWIVSYSVHAQIYEAIRRRGATDARRAMTLHMAMAADELRRLELLAPVSPSELSESFGEGENVAQR